MDTIHREYQITRRSYFNRLHKGNKAKSYCKKGIDICHMLDNPVNQRKMQQTRSFSCQHCKQKILGNGKKVVCNLNQRRNLTSFLCQNCFATYEQKKNNFLTSKCFVCNSTHSYPKNWKECSLCLTKKPQVIDLHCPKTECEKYNQTTKKKFVVRHMCFECKEKWNIRDKGCAFCRQDHSWDKDALKHFKFVRRGLSMPFYFQNMEQILGNEVASFIIADIFLD